MIKTCIQTVTFSRNTKLRSIFHEQNKVLTSIGSQKLIERINLIRFSGELILHLASLTFGLISSLRNQIMSILLKIVF